MRTDADTYQSAPLRVQPDGNISTPFFGFLNTYIANAATTAKSEAKADSAARMDASFLTGLRLVSAGDAAWNSSGSDGYAPGSALVTGFNMGFTGTSNANGVLHCKYLQYFIPAVGWVTM